MDELDLIRSFRGEVPAPAPAARARALRAWDVPARPRRLRVPRLVPIGAGVAAAVALGITVFGDGGHPTDARAAQTLRDAATAAEKAGLPVPRDGQHLYLRSREAYVQSTGGYRFLQPFVRETWMGADGSYRTSSRFEAVRFPTERDRARWVAAGRPDLSKLGAHPAGDVEAHDFGRVPAIQFGDRAITYAQLLELPTDPARLYDAIRAQARKGGGSSVEDESFAIVSDVVRRVPLPADLRAAFFRAAAMVPGTDYLPRARDLAGRAGVGVSFGDDVLVFDPDTGRLLGTRETAYLQEAVVGSDTSRPR